MNHSVTLLSFLMIFIALAGASGMSGNCEQAQYLLNQDPKPDYDYAHSLFNNCSCFEYKTEDIDKAKMCYNKVKKSCDQIDVFSKDGDSAISLGEASKDKLEELEARIGPPPGNRCTCLIDSSNNATIAKYDRVIEQNRSNALAWNDRGVLLGKLCCSDESLRSFEEALRINSNLTEAWYNKGVLLYWTNPSESLRSFDRSLQLNSNLAEAWFNRCALLMPDSMNMSNPSYEMAYEEATSSYEKAINLMPGLADYEPPYLIFKRTGE